jgi:predicted polyphosphate/ATP-dependent NAD kinase
LSTLGVIASPVAGKDVRRLVVNAGSVGDVDKIASIRRAVFGAVAAGVERVLVLDDSRHLVLRACEGVDAQVEVLDVEPVGAGMDSRRGAVALADAGVGAVLVFGGDGTNRDVARGWPDAPIVPLAVGTNNVFPMAIESTLGGAAAGLVASGQLELTDVASRAKIIHVSVDGADDIALVDVVMVAGSFIGSRAVWHVEDLRAAVFAVAEPATVGLSSIGAAVAPTSRHDDNGLAMRFGAGTSCVVRAPIAPGTYAPVGIDAWQTVELDEPVTLRGPGVLAFDGERDHVLRGARSSATAVIRRDGPWVIDPVAALELAAAKHLFTIDQ